MNFAVWLVEAILVFVIASFASDVVHYVLHAMPNSLGGLHKAHHHFFDSNLKVHPKYVRVNIFHHLLPEYVTSAAAACFAFFICQPTVVLAVILYQTIAVSIEIFAYRGVGPHHKDLSEQMLTRSRGFFVGPMYHALHHKFPDSYIGSVTKLFDIVFGTACAISGRRFAVTGASGAFGSAIVHELQRLGGETTALDARNGDLSDELAWADVLVLCHGSKTDCMAANCDSFISLIEQFRAVASSRQVPIEVWAVGSEIECHPAFGQTEYAESKRAFAKKAREYFSNKRMVYRHIVPSAFTSRMGQGLISGKLAAKIALFLIRRGARYVPVTYTGVAFVNRLRFGWS